MPRRRNPPTLTLRPRPQLLIKCGGISAPSRRFVVFAKCADSSFPSKTARRNHGTSASVREQDTTEPVCGARTRCSTLRETTVSLTHNDSLAGGTVESVRSVLVCGCWGLFLSADLFGPGGVKWSRRQAPPPQRAFLICWHQPQHNKDQDVCSRTAPDTKERREAQRNLGGGDVRGVR